MSTMLAEPTIDKLGPTRILTDVSEDELAEGRSAYVRIEPQVGEPVTAVALHSRDEAYAVKQLFWMLTTHESGAIAEVRETITRDLGFEPQWDELHRRFEKVLETYTT